MIVAFDVNSLRGIKTGVGIYSYNLIQALRDLCANDTFKYYSCSILKGGLKNPVDIPTDSLNLIYSMRISQKLLFNLWKYLKFPKIELLIGRVDIVHGLFHLVPITRKAKKVVTIYDLTFITHPETHSPSNIKVLWRLTEYSVEESDAILTISENTKKDIMRYLHVPEGKIEVIYPGYDDKVFRKIQNQAILDQTRTKYKLPSSFILAVGTIEPRKNLNLLFRAYAKLPTGFRKKHKLVVTGGEGWLNENLNLYKQIDSLGITHDITFTGYLHHDEGLPLVYNAADLFVYPSLYEGFGFPPLEAMACGVPVITSNCSSLPEVVGDAGILIDPHDAEYLANAIQRVYEDADIHRQMSEKGIKQAQKFSWEKCAKETLKVYQQLHEDQA